MAKKCIGHELRTPLQQGKPLLENYSKEMTKEEEKKKKEKKKNPRFPFLGCYFLQSSGDCEHGKSTRKNHRLDPKMPFPMLWLPFHLKLPSLEIELLQKKKKISSRKKNQLLYRCLVLCSGFVGCKGCP